MAPKHIAAEIVVQFAGGREFERTRAAVQQLSAQAAFELLDLLACGGLADPAVQGTSAHAPVNGYLFEKKCLCYVHEHKSIISGANVNSILNIGCLIVLNLL